MVVEKDKMVSLIYTLRELDANGKVIEQVDESNPLSFMFGTGQMLQQFEANIATLAKGDNFEFALNSDEAYGDLREELIVDIPRNIFEVDGKFDESICKVGNQVPMADSQGRRLLGVVTEIKEEAVAMDFNHPMAGVNLHFAGNILEVREATEDEVKMYQGDSDCSTCGSHSSCEGHC